MENLKAAKMRSEHQISLMETKKIQLMTDNDNKFYLKEIDRNKNPGNFDHHII